MNPDAPTMNPPESQLRELLARHGHPEPEAWAALIAQKPMEARLSILRTLLPEAWLSDEARGLHERLSGQYPELLRILEGTCAFTTAFPAAGIPAQAVAIDRRVPAAFNAGIGMARNEAGDVLMNPCFQEIFDRLRPDEVSEDDWRRVRNAVFRYNPGLGAPWYREVAMARYLADGESDPVALARLRRALRIRPIPAYGGTTALSIALDVGVGEQCRLILPRTYWGNINLKLAHARAIKDVCDLVDGDGLIRPEVLWRRLEAARAEGFSKVAVYFNFPHNPTGIVPTREQAAELEDIIQGSADPGFRIVVLCDEPYYPFVRGKDVIRVPFSHYMKPGDNRNVLTFASINGTKRDGMYGLRHADLVVLTPESVSDEAIELFERGVLAGYMRGAFSFSCALSQYLLARALTGDPLVCLGAQGATLSEHFLREEGRMVAYVERGVESTLAALDGIPDLRRITGSDRNAAYGGFFVTFQVSGRLAAAGVTAFDLHRAGLRHECGIIATNGLVRISCLVAARDQARFRANLEATIEDALLEKTASSG